MSYEVYITREKFLFEGDGPAITIEEWRKVVGSYPDFENGTEKDFNFERWWMWHPEGQCYEAFDYNDGVIWVSKPRRKTLIRMVEIAKQLHARVIGIDQEVYDEYGIPNKKGGYEPENN